MIHTQIAPNLLGHFSLFVVVVVVWGFPVAALHYVRHGHVIDILAAVSRAGGWGERGLEGVTNSPAHLNRCCDVVCLLCIVLKLMSIAAVFHMESAITCTQMSDRADLDRSLALALSSSLYGTAHIKSSRAATT